MNIFDKIIVIDRVAQYTIMADIIDEKYKTLYDTLTSFNISESFVKDVVSYIEKNTLDNYHSAIGIDIAEHVIVFALVNNQVSYIDLDYFKSRAEIIDVTNSINYENYKTICKYNDTIIWAEYGVITKSLVSSNNFTHRSFITEGSYIITEGSYIINKGYFHKLGETSGDLILFMYSLEN